jgi:serine/threonine protein kinase
MQIIKGLIFLKNNHISHLDLKPANILISKNHTIKLIDFG